MRGISAYSYLTPDSILHSDLQSIVHSDLQSILHPNLQSIVHSNLHSIVHSNLQSIVHSNLQVDMSGVKPSVTIEPFQCLNLDVKASAVRSVEDALTAFVEPEQLEGSAHPFTTS